MPLYSAVDQPINGVEVRVGMDGTNLDAAAPSNIPRLQVPAIESRPTARLAVNVDSNTLSADFAVAATVNGTTFGIVVYLPGETGTKLSAPFAVVQDDVLSTQANAPNSLPSELARYTATIG